MPRYSSRAGVELININPALPVSSRFNAKLFNHHQYSNHHRTNSPVSTQPFGDLSPHLLVLPVDCYTALLEQTVIFQTRGNADIHIHLLLLLLLHRVIIIAFLLSACLFHASSCDSDSSSPSGASSMDIPFVAIDSKAAACLSGLKMASSPIFAHPFAIISFLDCSWFHTPTPTPPARELSKAVKSLFMHISTKSCGTKINQYTVFSCKQELLHSA